MQIGIWSEIDRYRHKTFGKKTEINAPVEVDSYPVTHIRTSIFSYGPILIEKGSQSTIVLMGPRTYDLSVVASPRQFTAGKGRSYGQDAFQ